MNELTVIRRAPEWQGLKPLVLDKRFLAGYEAGLQHGPG